MASSEINLLNKRAVSGPMGFITAIEPKVRVVAWWGLLGLLGVGIFLGLAFLFVNSRYRRLEEQKIQITQQLKNAAAKEGIVVSLKQRITVAQKALDVARPWGKLFPLLGQIGPVNQFVTLTVDDSGRVNTIIEVQSIDEAVQIVTNTINLSTEKMLRSPQLLSFSLREIGTVQLGLSFIPIF